MTFDELLEKIVSEPARSYEREIRVPSPELKEQIRRGAMLASDLLADPRYTLTRRTFRTGHVLGAPVSDNDLARWRGAWPRHRLPEDVVALLKRANGIHLWADLDEGRSYEGLAPLDEWEPARVKMWGRDSDATLLGDHYLAVSYHADRAAFVVLNVDTGLYFLMDACGADESCPVGHSVEDLLDWFWSHRIP